MCGRYALNISGEDLAIESFSISLTTIAICLYFLGVLFGLMPKPYS